MDRERDCGIRCMHSLRGVLIRSQEKDTEPEPRLLSRISCKHEVALYSLIMA